MHVVLDARYARHVRDPVRLGVHGSHDLAQSDVHGFGVLVLHGALPFHASLHLASACNVPRAVETFLSQHDR